MLDLLTVSQIAERLSRSSRQIDYAIRTRRIAADRMAGTCRLNGKAAVGKIAAALREITAQKQDSRSSPAG